MHIQPDCALSVYEGNCVFEVMSGVLNGIVVCFDGSSQFDSGTECDYR